MIVDAIGENLVILRYQGKTVELRGVLRELFLYLFWHKERIITFKDIWLHLYTSKVHHPYRPDG